VSEYTIHQDTLFPFYDTYIFSGQSFSSLLPVGTGHVAFGGGIWWRDLTIDWGDIGGRRTVFSYGRAIKAFLLHRERHVGHTTVYIMYQAGPDRKAAHIFASLVMSCNNRHMTVLFFCLLES